MRIPLLPPPGIVSDDTSFATPGTYADGSNVRFWLGKPQVVGGWADALNTTLTGICRNVLPWTDNDGFTNIAFGTHSKLQLYKGGSLYDITPSGLTAGAEHGAGGPGFGAGDYGGGAYGAASTDDYFPRTWSLANFGQLLMASPRMGGLYVWENDTANDATVVATAPDNIVCMLVTPERQVLAFGCNEEVSTNFNGLCIRGSDIEDYADWTTASDNNAFEHILEGGGRIVGARLFGPYVAVWTDFAVHLGQFIGDPGQTYRFDRIASNCGLVGPNAVHVLNQTAYWITPDYQVMTWSLGGVPTLVPCPIRNDFKDHLAPGQYDKICATSVSQYGEVWWFYPDSRDGIENSRYIAVSTLDGSWFRGRLARSAAVDSGPTAFPLFVTPDGRGYSHENGQTANGEALNWFIQTSDQYLDEAQRYVMIRGFWPDFEDQAGPVSLEIQLRPYPQSAAVTKGPFALTAGKNKKDLLMSGRIAAVRFFGASSPAFMRLGKPGFDVVLTGQE